MHKAPLCNRKSGLAPRLRRRLAGAHLVFGSNEHKAFAIKQVCERLDVQQEMAKSLSQAAANRYLWRLAQPQEEEEHST
jgi:hypothetical protein